MGFHSKTFYANITHVRTNHIGSIDCMNRYLSTCNNKSQYILHATTHDAQLHLRAFLATQPFHNVDTCHLNTSDCRVVDTDDTVASKDTHLLRRSVDNGLDNDKRIFNHIELHTNTLKIALQRFVHRLGLFCIGVGRMWVELLKHTPDSILRQLLFVHRVHIEVGNSHLC